MNTIGIYVAKNPVQVECVFWKVSGVHITYSKHHETGTGYWPLLESRDTLTPKGRLIFDVVASIEQFGREGF